MLLRFSLLRSVSSTVNLRKGYAPASTSVTLTAPSDPDFRPLTCIYQPLSGLLDALSSPFAVPAQFTSQFLSKKEKGSRSSGGREGHGIEPWKKGRSGRVDRIMSVYRVVQKMCEDEDSGEDDGHRWEQITRKGISRCLKWAHLAKRESHQT